MARRQRHDSEALFSSHIYNGPPAAEGYRQFLRANAREEALAFVDESYRRSTTSAQGYYTLTATIVAAQDLPGMREALKVQTGGGYWHTTEAYFARTPGQAQAAGVWTGNIAPMLETTGDYIDQAVVTVHTAVQPFPEATAYTTAREAALEEARAECVTTMLKTLAEDPGERSTPW